MVYNINVEFQIRELNKQSNIQSNKQNGEDKKSESTSPASSASSAKQERRTDNEVRIEVGESGTSSGEAFKGDETSCKCEEGDCEEIVEKTYG